MLSTRRVQQIAPAPPAQGRQLHVGRHARSTTTSTSPTATTCSSRSSTSRRRWPPRRPCRNARSCCAASPTRCPMALLQLDTERNVVYHNARLLEILHVRERAGEARRARRRRSTGAPAHSLADAPRHAHRRGHRRLRSRARARCSTRASTSDVEVDVVLPRRSLAARADEHPRAAARRRRGERRDHLRARRHRQRPRAPGARGARHLRRAHALPQPHLDPRRARSRSSSARTRGDDGVVYVDLDQLQAGQRHASATPPATSCSSWSPSA